MRFRQFAAPIVLFGLLLSSRVSRNPAQSEALFAWTPRPSFRPQLRAPPLPDRAVPGIMHK
jgi:hypothetical protein